MRIIERRGNAAQVERVRSEASSLAQCDLIHLTLTEAAIRARRADRARALVAERMAQMPASPLKEAGPSVKIFGRGDTSGMLAFSVELFCFNNPAPSYTLLPALPERGAAAVRR